MKTIFGYGQLRLRNGNGSVIVNFDSTHSILFIKSNLRQTSVTNLFHLTDILYRPYITAQIVIKSNNDISKIALLLLLLNNYTTDGLFITPQNSVNNNINELYECMLDTDLINFEHISTSKVTQVIELRFIGRYLTKMPIQYSNPTIYTLIDNNDNIITALVGTTTYTMAIEA